ncbi:MAG: hypothetical protein J5517_05015 [Eubacterium sp.]|nr:hypothetical protein [Eubacterium sp.]
MNNKGYMSIEASFVIPILLLGILVVLAGLIIMFEKSVISVEEVESIYSIPLENIRDDRVKDYLCSKSPGERIEYGQVETSSDYVLHKASYDGTLDYFKSFGISFKREIDVCTDRMRRWQLYDDIGEKSGD